MNRRIARQIGPFPLDPYAMIGSPARFLDYNKFSTEASLLAADGWDVVIDRTAGTLTVTIYWLDEKPAPEHGMGGVR